jgi:twitching motility protein PilT
MLRSRLRRTGHLVFGTFAHHGGGEDDRPYRKCLPDEPAGTDSDPAFDGAAGGDFQLLLPRCDKPGRVAVFEIMINTPSVAALIRDNKTFRINSDIQTGAKYGMVTLDSFLMEKYQAGLISKEEVITKAQDAVTIQTKLQEYEMAQALSQAKGPPGKRPNPTASALLKSI